MKLPHHTGSHAVFELRLHIVLVTRYRRPVLDPEVLAEVRAACVDVLTAWRCTLIEFGAEADHVHLLVDIHPALGISALINNLKSASSKRVGNRYATRLRRHYRQPGLWHRAYYVGSVGGASLDTVRAYVEAQGQEPPSRPPARPTS
jgi:putative transposase